MRQYFLLFMLMSGTVAGLRVQAQTKTCLKGDCKGGQGVMRVEQGASRIYQIGTFNRKGQLNGKGDELQWSYSSVGLEADFLFSLSQGMPSMESLWELKPSVIRSGQFKDGMLQGTGVILMNDLSYFNNIAWVADNWLGRNGLKYVRYEGDFIDSKPQSSGVVTLMYPSDTLICASDQLIAPVTNYADVVDQAEMVIDIRRNDGFSSELIRGTFLNHQLHGWAVVHRKTLLNKTGLFYRQLWSYGKKIFEDDGGAYPFDMDNPQTLTLPGGVKITGPVQNGKVNGFGTIEWGYNLKYTGYLKDNLPDGYGQLDSMTQKHGLFSNGKFVQGYWIYYGLNRLNVEEGRYDQFREGRIKRSCYTNLAAYLRGAKPFEGWEGYYIEGSGWQGLVTSFDPNTKSETWYEKGMIQKRDASINNISVWQVYVKDGMASIMVSYDPITRTGTLADGRTINEQNKGQYKPSKYNSSHFYTMCPCGGDAKTTRTAEVSGYTKSWTRTEQVNKSAVVGYWQGTQQVTSTYYTPGYSITTKVACENPDAVWAPFGVGTRHSVLRAKSLKE